MRNFRALFLRILGLFNRERRDRELDDEVESNLQMQIDDNLQRGMSPDEARYAALRKFGNVTLVKEEARELWSFVLFEQLWQDIRFGLRMLVKNPGFTAVAMLTLALGIGVNTAIFSVVDAVLLKPLPYPHPERIVIVFEQPPSGGLNQVSTPDFLDWKGQTTVFSTIAAEDWGTKTLTDIGAPVDLSAESVSANYFEIPGVKPLLGRTFAPDEDQPGKQYKVVLSHRIWRTLFGADPNIVGRSIRLSGMDYAVVGVMPAGLFDRWGTDVRIPLAFEPKDRARDYRWFHVWARLKPGVTLEQARQEMKVIAGRVARDNPQSNKGWSATVERYVDLRLNDSLRRSLCVLLAAAGAVLLIGCVNLANLSLSRGVGREREVALRSALGAGRGRLVRQLLTESIVLAGLGGAVGVALGWALMRGLKAWVPSSLLPIEADVQLDERVLLFATVLIILSGLLSGIAPAVRATPSDLAGSLKEGVRGATSGVGHKQLRHALVVTEIALAFVLLSGAGLLIRSFYRLSQVNLGFDATNVITAGLPMAPEEYPEMHRVINYQEQVLGKIRAAPGVREVAITNALPLEGPGISLPFLIEGKPFVNMAGRPNCGFKRVSPSYLATLRMHLLRGRWLAETDEPGTLPVAIINETMAQRYFKDQDPIGRRILIPPITRPPSSSSQWVTGQPLAPEVAWEVVGVVRDEKLSSVDGWYPTLYVSYRQSPTLQTWLAVRGGIPSAQLVKTVQTAVWQLNKNQPFDKIRTLDEIISDSLGESRLGTVLLGAFAILALLLAAIGIYGVFSYSVGQRTHEIGIRSALGATRGDILRLVLEEGMILALMGVGIGIFAAFGLTRLLAGLLYGIRPRDPLTFVSLSLLLAGVALFACLIPARRATKVDPMVALRHE
jgi:putative ABC transport system permease protein